MDESEIVRLIERFYEKSGRIPLKREFPHYHAARGRFGTWNNAIKTAGFDPNPVMFANKYVANDGHKCDSLAEKIVDDWLYARNIKHKTNVPYPGNDGLSADFKVGDFWIEFFGLHGQHKKYDELKEKKSKLVKKYNLNLIALYPKHLFPKNKLNKVLKLFIGQTG